MGSHGANTLTSVWCAKDRQDAMNKAKAREELPAASCDTPIAKQYQLGQMIGGRVRRPSFSPTVK